MNYLNPALDRNSIGQVSVLGLAYIGDGVYELLVRTWLLEHTHTAALDLHRLTVSLVNASAQADGYAAVSDRLTEEETAVFKRGRNAKVNQIPHHATSAEYHTATGLEALFGWLYLSGRQERVQELFSLIMEKAGYDDRQ